MLRRKYETRPVLLRGIKASIFIWDFLPWIAQAAETVSMYARREILLCR